MTVMPDSSQSLLSLTLAGQALLQSDPNLIAVPGDAESPLADEIRLAQAAPEPAKSEYDRLFFNPIGVECHFWQSVYANESRLFGPAHHSALDWFRRYGAEPQHSNEPADHLGLLLLFYARLIEEGEPADVIGAYFNEHIAWASEFALKLQQHARHPLYLVLARELQSILAAGPDQAM
jgi:TorA maturation chaperone TorD